METKEAKIRIQKDDDGHWLLFKDSTGKEAMINIENTFTDNTMIGFCVRQWAMDQFEENK